MSEPLTLREALMLEFIKDNDGEAASVVDYAIDNLAPDWGERVALIDEMARLDRLLPDGWDFVLKTEQAGFWWVGAWSPVTARDALPDVAGWRPSRLGALRALNDELSARRDDNELERRASEARR